MLSDIFSMYLLVDSDVHWRNRATMQKLPQSYKTLGEIVFCNNSWVKMSSEGKILHLKRISKQIMHRTKLAWIFNAVFSCLHVEFKKKKLEKQKQPPQDFSSVLGFAFDDIAEAWVGAKTIIFRSLPPCGPSKGLRLL